jgi:hypothetical protein
MSPGKWIKATRSSGNGGSCVEIRHRNGTVEVRDTKDHGAGPTLTFTQVAFNAFLDGIRRGEFAPRSDPKQTTTR